MSGYSKQCMARKSIMCALTRAQAQIDRLTKERDEARQEGTAAGCVVAINVMRADRDRAERERDEAQLMVQHNLEAAQRAEAQLEQAVALLDKALTDLERARKGTT